jgi:hypothetical protein
MDSNTMMFLLSMMVGGLLIVTQFYYGGRFVLRLLETPDQTQVREYGPTTVAHTNFTPDTSAQDQVSAAYQQPAVIRVLPLQESGIPYASRST